MGLRHIETINPTRSRGGWILREYWYWTHRRNSIRAYPRELGIFRSFSCTEYQWCFNLCFFFTSFFWGRNDPSLNFSTPSSSSFTFTTMVDPWKFGDGWNELISKDWGIKVWTMDETSLKKEAVGWRIFVYAKKLGKQTSWICFLLHRWYFL